MKYFVLLAGYGETKPWDELTASQPTTSSSVRSSTSPDSPPVEPRRRNRSRRPGATAAPPRGEEGRPGARARWHTS